MNYYTFGAALEKIHTHSRSCYKKKKWYYVGDFFCDLQQMWNIAQMYIAGGVLGGAGVGAFFKSGLKDDTALILHRY